MGRARIAMVLVLGTMLAAACSEDKKATDLATDPGVADLPAADVPPVADVPTADRPPADLPPADEGPADPGAPDLGPPDPGPQDPGQPDPGPTDPGQPDPGKPDPGAPDLGPVDTYVDDVTETVAACIYVVENVCAKALTKCDLLGLIPPAWMQTCTDFLTGNHGTVLTACETLDNAQSSDPNVQLIQQMGPLALEQCIDNFQCTLETGTKLYQFLQPIVGGAKVDTNAILSLVVGLCFTS